MIDHDDIREMIRRALEARYNYLECMRIGAPLRYGSAIWSTPDRSMLRLITMSDSMIMTAGVVRRIAGRVTWIWGSTPAMFSHPVGLDDGDPVDELQGTYWFTHTC